MKRMTSLGCGLILVALASCSGGNPEREATMPSMDWPTADSIPRGGPHPQRGGGGSLDNPKVRIESESDNDLVLIDGEQSGVSNRTHVVEPGTHKITLVHWETRDVLCTKTVPDLRKGQVLCLLCDTRARSTKAREFRSCPRR